MAVVGSVLVRWLQCVIGGVRLRANARCVVVVSTMCGIIVGGIRDVSQGSSMCNFCVVKASR